MLTGVSWRLERGQLPFEEPPLVVGVHELERARISGARLVDAVEPAEELGAGGVQVVVARRGRGSR